MTIPLMVLAGLRAAGRAGLRADAACSSTTWRRRSGSSACRHLEHHATDWATPLVGLLAGLLGLGLSYVLYAAPSPIPGRLAARLGPLYRASLNKFYVDEFYDAVVVRTTLVAARSPSSSTSTWSTAWSGSRPGCPGWSAARSWRRSRTA